MCRSAGDLPIVGDGDTGFGGVANVRRTVLEYHRAGFAAVTIEDQVFPKRCAFAAGMNVVSRGEALARLAAALDARDDIRAAGGDILVVGRTDCRLAANVGSDGFAEAMWRCEAFADLGADIVYFEVWMAWKVHEKAIFDANPTVCDVKKCNACSNLYTKLLFPLRWLCCCINNST